MTRLQFLKVLGNKFAYKSSPKRLLTLGFVNKNQTAVYFTYLGQLLETFEQLFCSRIWSHLVKVILRHEKRSSQQMCSLTVLKRKRRKKIDKLTKNCEMFN